MSKTPLGLDGDTTSTIIVKVPTSWKNKLLEGGYISHEVRKALKAYLGISENGVSKPEFSTPPPSQPEIEREPGISEELLMSVIKRIENLEKASIPGEPVEQSSETKQFQSLF